MQNRDRRLVEREPLEWEWRREHRPPERIQNTEQAKAIPNQQFPLSNMASAEGPPNQRSAESGEDVEIASLECHECRAPVYR